LEAMDRTCAELGVSSGEEIKRLLLHGILHLAGFDHDEADPRGEMLDIQESLLHRLSEVVLP
ncbi:MAG TPA: rRNA maturation RNase YbeY, partial [Magnetospirillaceae bacterium]|nr:rRNA maturation RNase YbeY [Magnetospirillaceae bacterium]